MARTYEEIVGGLDDEDKAVVQGVVDAEKARGIEASRKKGADVTKWMTAANKLKDAIRELELDPDSDVGPQVAALKAKITKATETGASASDMEKRFQKQIDELKKIVDDEREAKELANKQLTNATLKEHLSKAFGDSVIGAEDTIDLMILKGKAKLNDEGKPVIVEGDTEMDLNAGVEAFKKANPNRVVNNSRAGGGSSAGGSGGKGKQEKTLTREQFDTMSVKDRAAWFVVNPGGAVVD